MSFGESVRAKRVSDGINLKDFAERIGLSVAYWSRVERGQEHPPRDVYIEKAAGILGLRLDDLFVEAGRLPPDMRQDIEGVIWVYRSRRQPRTIAEAAPITLLDQTGATQQ